MYDVVVIGNPLYSTFSTQGFKSPDRILSGPATIVSRVSANLGVENLIMVGAVGPDFKTKLGIDTDASGIPEYYAIDSLETSGFHVGCDDSGLLTMELLAAARRLRIRDIPDELTDSRYIVIVPGYREIDLEILSWLSDVSPARIVFDPQGMAYDTDSHGRIVIKPNKSKILESMKYVDVIKMERSLWRLIIDEPDPLLAAEFLVEQGAEIGIAMFSSLGATIYDKDEFYIVPIERTIPKNPLAASNAFLGAFVVGMLHEQNMLERASLAASAASAVIERDCTDTDFQAKDLLARQASLLDKITIK